MNFTGRTALVTGAAGGIGRAITQMLREAGVRVTAPDQYVSGTEAALHLSGDLTDADYASALPEAARERLWRAEHFGQQCARHAGRSSEGHQ